MIPGTAEAFGLNSTTADDDDDSSRPSPPSSSATETAGTSSGQRFSKESRVGTDTTRCSVDLAEMVLFAELYART